MKLKVIEITLFMSPKSINLQLFTLILSGVPLFFALFQSCCSHAQVFGKTLVHEFPISYRHTEWHPFFVNRHD